MEIVKKCIPKQMGEDMTLQDKIDSALLKLQLEKFEKGGVRLYLNGVPSTTEYIVDHCVNEDTVYMPDYVADENGKITEIRYDRIFYR